MSDGKTSVTIVETRIVSLDRAYYSISDARYEMWLRNLRDDPVLGESKDGVNYEYLLASVSMHYILHVDRNGICLTIVGVRPVEAISSSKFVVKGLERIVGIADKIRSILNLLNWTR